MSDPRELDTQPHNDIPEFVGSAPDVIPGAPDWANEWFSRDHKERAELREMLHDVRADQRRLLANQRTQGAAFRAFRDEARSRLGSHDVELREIRDEIEALTERLNEIDRGDDG